MPADRAMLAAMGGEEGCRRLSAQFYARVATDPVLRRLFPGKSLRCAIEEFGAFLIQFLGGDEGQTQYRWHLSLRESHARFRISAAERSAWLKNMRATLDAAPLEEATRKALREFFLHGSAYVIGKESEAPAHAELGERWREQCSLDDAIDAVRSARDGEVIALAPRFASRPSVFAGLLARMMQTGRVLLVRYVAESIESDPALAERRFSGRTLLHAAAAAGCVEVTALLLRLGTDANLLDRGGHTPLYSVANECSGESGPEVVRMLVRAGADVNACGGVTRATPLHMAARRNHLEIARALLDCGASIDAPDRKGDTPLQRAIHCRQDAVRRLLLERGGTLSKR